MATSKHTWCSAAKRTAKEIETYEAKVMKGINEDEVLREWNELNRHREETMGSTRKKIGILRINFDELRAMLKDTTLQNSNKNFPHLLETFENKLSSFKLTMRTDYDYLEQAERGLAKDIIQLASSMEDWYIEDHNKSFHEEMLQQQRERHQERQNTDIERKAIIGSIDRKIVALGRNGGWDVRDHDLFIRVWTSVIDSKLLKDGENANDYLEVDDENEVLVLTSDQTTMLVRKLGVVPAKSMQELEEHIEWYQKYLYFIRLKKDIVAEWKKETESKKIRHRQEVLVDEVLNIGESVEDINLADVNNSSDSQPVKTVEERLAKKDQIKKWKEDKQRKKEQEEEIKLLNMNKDKIEAAEQLRKRQASLKSRLSEWKSSEDLAKEVAEEEKPKPVDPEVLKMRQARDLEIAKEKLSKKDAMVQKMNEREQKQKEMHVSVLDKEVTRDPNRLLSGTKASEANKLSYDDLDDAERKRTEAGAHGAKVAMNGRDLKFSGRAIPEWRKPTI